MTITALQYLPNSPVAELLKQAAEQKEEPPGKRLVKALLVPPVAVLGGTLAGAGIGAGVDFAYNKINGAPLSPAAYRLVQRLTTLGGSALGAMLAEKQQQEIASAFQSYKQRRQSRLRRSRLAY